MSPSNLLGSIQLAIYCSITSSLSWFMSYKLAFVGRDNCTSSLVNKNNCNTITSKNLTKANKFSHNGHCIYLSIK